MRNKTRKFIWSAPLVAALAIIGALTLAGVLLLPNADNAEAQDAAPANVTTSNVTQTTVDVTWDAVAGAQTYEVQYATAAAPTTFTTSTATPANFRILNATMQARISNLTAGTEYIVQVRGIGLGDGPWSDSAEVETLALAEPGMPTGLMLEEGETAGTADVSWTAPANNGGAAISAFGVTISPSADGEACPDGGATDSSTTCTGLTAGTEYTISVVATNSEGDSEAATGMITVGLSTAELESSSTSASATVKLTLTIELEESLTGSSWVEIYLENDYQEPSSISKDAVIFEVTGTPTTAFNAVGDAGDAGLRHATPDTSFTAAEVELDDGGEIAGEEDAVVISARVPDMLNGDEVGYPKAGQTLMVVVEKAAGVKNPSEQGSHSTGFSIIGGTDDRADEAEMKLMDLETKAKISLSEEDDSRGYELTVTGSGFNNGTSAGAYVYHTTGTAPACPMIVAMGTRAGAGTVGSDDKVAITFEVTVPTFGPGATNYICVVDGEGLMSSDVDTFELEPSISLSPSTANVGDTVTVFAQDFMMNDATALGLKLAGQPSSHATRGFSTSGGSIGRDGSGTATFVVPGWAEGTLRVDAWGENAKLTVIGSTLKISKSSALPNELITITGDGFGTGSGNHIDVERVTIDGVPLEVHEDSETDGEIDVSNSGQFVATVVLWPAGSGTNPTLDAGVHTIKVVDSLGFSGTATITVPDPMVTLTPTIAGPRDVITISGENWPVDNIEGSTPPTVMIDVDDGRPRTYSALPDSAGRWFVEHRIASTVAIPSTNRVTASVGSEIVKVVTFEVPAAIIDVTPGEGQPGDTITLMVDKMPVYAAVDSIQIAGRDVLPVGNFSTDRTGSVTVEGVVLPGLDPGTYSVLMDIDGTVAIGSVDVLAEVVGTDTPTADALAPLGDSLQAAFYFDNVIKTWSFYDPRPEFAELNTLTSLIQGEAYWVLVSDNVDDVVLNNKSRSLTCAGGDCWNLVIW